MSKRVLYLAVGEEAVRGTKEVTTLGFVPLMSAAVPTSEFADEKRGEFRGDEAAKGEDLVRRLGRKWNGPFEIPFFTEAGTTAGMIGTIIKHFFAHVVSTQNGATAQYAHMMSPVECLEDAAALDTKALTFNLNISEHSAVKNWPYVGGRVKSLTFDFEPGLPVKMTIETLGQFRDTPTAEIGSPVFAAENLRADYNNFTLYFGAGITRTGTGPDYTDILPNTMLSIAADKVTFKLDNGAEDKMRLSGVNYPDKTQFGQFTGTLDITIDWEDPATGFSSVDEFNAYMTAIGSESFLLICDTGTQAGTGDNHALIIDIPIANRTGGAPEFDRATDPTITLSYEMLYDPTTTKYLAGIMLKNTAAAV